MGHHVGEASNPGPHPNCPACKGGKMIFARSGYCGDCGARASSRACSMGEATRVLKCQRCDICICIDCVGKFTEKSPSGRHAPDDWELAECIQQIAGEAMTADNLPPDASRLAR